MWYLFSALGVLVFALSMGEEGVNTNNSKAELREEDDVYITDILFRQIGSLAGAVTYGHLSFEIDLNAMDKHHDKVVDEVLNYRKKFNKAKVDYLARISEAGRKALPHPWNYFAQIWHRITNETSDFINLIDHKYIKEYIDALAKESYALSL